MMSCSPPNVFEPAPVREDERNRLLRRVDWRFLLPNPQPSQSVCFVNGELLRAVSSISQGLTPMAARDCELAVAVNPTCETLRRAWDSLRAGGSLYTEWYAPCALGVHRVRQKLREVGFNDITCYWAWPPPHRAPAQFWLPLAAPPALHYFLNSRPNYGHALTHTAIRAAFRALAAREFIFPIYAIARKRSRDAKSEARPYAQLLLTGGQRSLNKVVALVFERGAPEPQRVIKYARVREATPTLAREVATLRGLALRFPDGISGVPHVLFYDEREGLAQADETFVSGVPLWARLHRQTYSVLASQATDWVLQLVKRRLVHAPEALWEHLVAPVLADFDKAFGEAVGANVLLQTRDILRELPALPLACEQRDFSPWNVLLSPAGEIVVLDWESATLHGLPLLDLVYFLTYLAFFLEGALERGQARASYRASLDTNTFTGNVNADCLARYVSEVGIAREAVRPLRLFTWLLHARSEYARLVADAGGAPTVKNLRESLFVGLIEEELGE